MSTDGPRRVPPIPMPMWMGAAAPAAESEAPPAGGGSDDSRREPPVTLKAIKDYLRQTKLGAEVVAFFETRGLRFKESPRGCFWDGEYVRIDRNYSLPVAALSFVHEVYHARASDEGRSGNRFSQSRDEYLKTMFNEEVQATIAAIKVRLELNKEGAPLVAPPRYFEYHAGRRAAKKQLLERSPDATPAELEAAMEQGGYDALMALFVSDRKSVV